MADKQSKIQKKRSSAEISDIKKSSRSVTSNNSNVPEQERDQFHFLSDSALMGIVILQDGLIKYANQSIADIFEYSIEEMKAWGPNGFARVIHPDHFDFVMEQARKKQAGETDVVTQYEYKIKTKGGEIKWIEQYSKTIQYEGRFADYVTMVDVTKRKQAVSALILSESRYRELFNSAMEGIAIVDENEIIQFCNPAFVKIFEEDSYVSMVGKSLFKYLPEDQKEYLHSLTKKRSNNIASQYEIDIITAKGNKRIVRVSASPRFNKDGVYIGAFGTVIDQTDIRNAEKALMDSVRSYQTLAKNLPGLVFRVLCQKGDTMQFFNDHLKALTGYTETELAAMEKFSISSLILEEDWPEVKKAIKDAVEKNISFEIKFRIRHKDGEIRHIIERGQPVFDSSNILQSIDGVIFDITHDWVAEEALKKAHEELERQYAERTRELEETNLRKKAIFDLYSIFELSRNFNALLDYKSLLDSFILAAIGRTGASGAALYLPPDLDHPELRLERAEGKYLFPASEMAIRRSEPCCEYITNLNRPIRITEILEKFKQSEALEFMKYFPEGLIVPLVYQTKLRGVLILSQKESKIDYPDGDIEFLSILASQAAVSIENARLYESEKEALSQLKGTQKQLVRSERSAALGDLSARIAHEINNPLGIIKNYLYLTSQNIQSDQKALDYTKIIKQEIDRIAKIVKQLLDFHRPAVARFEKADPRTIIDETLSLMEGKLNKAKIKVVVDIDESVPEMMVWLDGLKQVFINLLVNSIDAIEYDGEISFGARRDELTVQFMYEDSGPGIAPEHIPHIFDPYYTTKTESGGSGLGLSICKNIIKNHNGSISFKNTDKGGSFLIELPIEHKETNYDQHI